MRCDHKKSILRHEANAIYLPTHDAEGASIGLCGRIAPPPNRRQQLLRAAQIQFSHPKSFPVDLLCRSGYGSRNVFWFAGIVVPAAKQGEQLDAGH